MSSKATEERSSAVAQFYEGKTIFITGATGFMGKVIVEKLLHCCPGIDKIYLLVRLKKSEAMEHRLGKIKQGRVFQALRAHYPERLSKLEALEGDIALPGLGLSEADKLLLKQVNVVFNVAATINSNEDLRRSVVVNILATKTLLEMCLMITDLKSFVHVSTAYSNCDRKRIEERVYPAPVHLEELVQQCRDCSDNQVQELTTRMLGRKPNTYILTKSVAETVVHSYGDKMPIAIIRPSIVTCAAETPYPGWVDCKSGCTGFLTAAASGMLRIMYADRNITMDIVPVDMVDNLIIVAGWKTAKLGIAEPIVYNAVSGVANSITQGDLMDSVIRHSLETPHDTMLWYPSMIFTTSRWLHGIGRFFLHTVPAYLHDYILAPNGNIKLVQTQSSVQKVMRVLEYFLTTSFDFEYESVPRLLQDMSPRDREMFPIDVAQVEWFSYASTYARGIRKYLLGQKEENIPQAKKRLQMLYIKDMTLKATALVAACYVVVTWTTPLLVSKQTSATID